jgi:hypothetical protein
LAQDWGLQSRTLASPRLGQSAPGRSKIVVFFLYQNTRAPG